MLPSVLPLVSHAVWQFQDCRDRTGADRQPSLIGTRSKEKQTITDD
jgi:hypothetical protein